MLVTGVTRIVCKREAKGEPWRPDQLWIENGTGFLVDETGKQFSPWFFLGVGVIADLAGNGQLDMLDIDRLSMGGNPEYVDAVAIGPLDTRRPCKLIVYANFRSGQLEEREWRFELRGGHGESTDLVLVPTGEGSEVVFRSDGESMRSPGDVPNSVQVDREPKGEAWKAEKTFLATLGHHVEGWGIDEAFELDARLRTNRRASDDNRNPFSVPDDLRSLPPRRAALALVEHNRDNVHRWQFDLTSLGEPVGPPATGWVELQDDGGGWGRPSSTVWWLEMGRATRWKIDDDRIVSVSEVPRDQVSWAIAVVHELNRVRSLPSLDRISRKPHWQGGGDDYPFQRVRSITTKPKPETTALDWNMSALWHRIGGFYSREHAGVMAVVLAESFPEVGEGKTVEAGRLAREWLQPDRIGQVPPTLSRAAVIALGEGNAKELSILRKLRQEFGKPTADERRYAELTVEIAKLYKNRYKAKDEKQELEAESRRIRLQTELREIRERLLSEPRHALRSEVEKVLGKAVSGEKTK